MKDRSATKLIVAGALFPKSPDFSLEILNFFKKSNKAQ